MYIPVDLLKKNEAAASMPPEAIAARKAEIRAKSALELDGPKRVMDRRKMLAEVAPENMEVAFERYIGDNDLLPVNYLLIGAAKCKSVGRIRYFDKRVNRNAMATGFLISPDLVLTNNHVFSDPNAFQDAVMDFDYAYGVNGRELEKVTFALDPKKFFYANAALDCALIGIGESDETGRFAAAERGFLVLNAEVGKAGLGDYATIIQYPDGDYEQIALRGNQLLEIKDDSIIYVSDTSPGSSGAPVFNDQWQVIALHSAGVGKKDAAGRYVDRNGAVIPEVDGHIDASRIVWISNTGVRVTSLMNLWRGAPELKLNRFIQFLSDPSYTDALPQGASTGEPDASAAVESVTKRDEMKTVTIDPSGGYPGITININIGGAAPAPPRAVVEDSGRAPLAVKPLSDEEAVESKLEDEKNADYSRYTGFDEMFMGADLKTPLPTLSKDLARRAATFVHNSKQFVLKYAHYSSIHHAVRKMPIVSAVNVEGSAQLRKDDEDRVDNWFRDNRIDLDVQLTDDYYAKSGFDKGHMSRREDAKWGKTAGDAEDAAQRTCMYTNACPQVPTLNRAIFGFHGLWGQLEQIVLEKGVEAEAGKASRICVYNGPLFVTSDPVYKGVQVPMRFFKLIAWRNGANEMRATAFVLSQEDLVGGIHFEELQFDKEFLEHQCSVAYLEDKTGLTFTGIREFDTSPDKGNANAVGRIDRAGVENMVARHARRRNR